MPRKAVATAAPMAMERNTRKTDLGRLRKEFLRIRKSINKTDEG
jgi:hypothetical protein